MCILALVEDCEELGMILIIFITPFEFKVGREYSEVYELELENEMRTFFRHYYTHCRYISATPQVIAAVTLIHSDT